MIEIQYLKKIEPGESNVENNQDSPSQETTCNEVSLQDMSSKNKDLHLRKRFVGCSTGKDDGENEDTPLWKKSKKKSSSKNRSPDKKAKRNASRKPAKKHCKQLFCNTRREEFGGWLKKCESKSKPGDDLAHCIACEKCIIAHKTAILRHSESEKHVQNVAKSSTNKKIDDVPGLRLDTWIRRAELKLTCLLVINNLPFVLMDVLSPLCEDIFPDSEIAKQLAVRRTKATALMTKSLRKNFREGLYNTLRGLGSFFL